MFCSLRKIIYDFILHLKLSLQNSSSLNCIEIQIQYSSLVYKNAILFICLNNCSMNMFFFIPVIIEALYPTIIFKKEINDLDRGLHFQI